jgi:hypothetical protein
MLLGVVVKGEAWFVGSQPATDPVAVYVASAMHDITPTPAADALGTFMLDRMNSPAAAVIRPIAFFPIFSPVLG